MRIKPYAAKYNMSARQFLEGVGPAPPDILEYFTAGWLQYLRRSGATADQVLDLVRLNNACTEGKNRILSFELDDLRVRVAAKAVELLQLDEEDFANVKKWAYEKAAQMGMTESVMEQFTDLFPESRRLLP